MANRVLIGKRGSEYGCYVSRPGANVLTADDDDLMLASHVPSLQIVDSGAISDPGSGSTVTRTIEDLGFRPFVIFSCEKYQLSLRYLSNTSIRFNVGAPLDTLSGPSRSGTIRYLVTNIPVQ